LYFKKLKKKKETSSIRGLAEAFSLNSFSLNFLLYN
jgi:hypothetical protein